jgi:hypothetical protein
MNAHDLAAVESCSGSQLLWVERNPGQGLRMR